MASSFASPASHEPSLPPGPRGPAASLRMFRDFSRCPPKQCRTVLDRYGDMVSFELFGARVVVVGDPQIAGEIMQDKDDAFSKDWVTRGLKLFLGEGLLTSEGELWKRQRKLIAPSLTKKQIAAYADTMVACTKQWLDTRQVGKTHDIHEEMTEVTLDIVVKTLFGTDMGTGHADVGHAMDRVMSDFQEVVQTWRQFFPEWVPFAARRRTVKTARSLDRVLYGIIKKRREGGEAGDDLLSRLLAARDDTGGRMSDEQLRDEAITLFVAGHETTANALSFAFLLLAEHPDVDAKVHAEVSRVLGGRDATSADVASLPYVDAVLRETLRLRPPAHIFGREALRDVTFGRYLLPKRSTVLISPWALHHDARFFPDPYAFRPERWLDGSTSSLPKHAYLPFGGGARVCIGNHFAMMEAALVLATAAARFRFERTSSEPVDLQAAVTLRPRGALGLRAVRR